RLGAVKVPVNYMLAPDTVDYIIGASGAKALVVDRAMATRITATITARPELRVFQVPDGGDLVAAGAQWLAPPPGPDTDLPRPAPSGAGPQNLAAIYFTGG